MIKLRLNGSIMLRMLIDFFLVNVSYATGFILRYAFISVFRKNTLPSTLMEKIWVDSMRSCFKFTLFLSVLSILVFAGYGFYTRNRLYRGKYKVLAVFNGVTTAYVIFFLLLYFLGIVYEIPKSVMIISWITTLTLVGGARIATFVLPRWGVIRHVPRREIRKNKCENILVIGGAGYIGSHLVRKLLDKGYFVRVLDLLVYGDDSIKDLYGKENFELIPGDFRNIENIVRSMEDIDAVIHLGAVVGDPACSINDRVTREINLAATRMIAEIAKGNGVRRFFFASTCSVYGASNHWLDEKSRLNPLSLYAVSKIESEKLLLSMMDDSFKPTIFRLATVHGFSYRPRFDLVVNLLSAMAIVDKKITIFGGSQWRPFVHVQDVADAFLMALEAPLNLIGGKIYNLGDNNENYLISQIGKIISAEVKDAEVVYVETKEDDRNYRVRFDRIRNDLGFTAKRDIRYTVKEIKDAISNGLVTNYKDPRYSNYKYLTEGDGLIRIDRDNSVRILSQFSK